MKKLEPVESVASDVLIEDFDGSLAKRITLDRLNTHKAVVELLEGMKIVHTKDCGVCNNCETHVSSCEAYLITYGKNKSLTDAIQKVDELFGVSNLA